MTKPRILMLGWEFPPNITGGLGVACYHIVKSLGSLAPVTMILPTVASGVRLRGVRLIGIGNLELETIFTKKEREQIRSKFRKRFSKLALSPYPVGISGGKILQKSSRVLRKRKISFPLKNILDGTELYGDDVVGKVEFFAEICGKMIRKIDFDIIHAHDWMTFPAALEIKKLTGKPLVLHIHSLNTDRVGLADQGWVFRIEKEALHKADLILPVSHYTGDMIREHYGIRKNKIHPVHNGVRKMKAFSIPKKFPEKLVLFLGRITYQKGPGYFLDVAARIAARHDNIRFVVAGGGDKFARMIEEGAYRELGKKLHFTGPVDRKKVRELLAMADVFVMPSVSEPFGLVALEAAQFGIPVILSKRAGAAEVLKGALKVDYWDIDKMESSIIRLISDDKFRENVVKQELKDLEKLSWEKTAGNILSAYSKIRGL
ncbi:MAG TPA: glycosyltransferase family 4 protein [Cyclobacteriaceae bacterium]|nr:glycosyltransferase family 4 protein [Cyclobacteriaceae bacterium]